MKKLTRRTFLSKSAMGYASLHLIPLIEDQRRTRWEMLANNAPMEPAPLRPTPSAWGNDTITACWVGHATVLINFFGMWIITDPVFSDRIGVNIANLFTIGPKRLVEAALTFEDLPHIDLVIVSHAHMDHLDTPSIRRFDRATPIVMAKNTVDVIEDLGFEAVYELDWGNWTEIDGLRIEALEVKHFGWRYPWEKDRSKGHVDGRSYNAYLLSRNGRHILFGGDTAFHENFRRLRDRGLSIDLAMMPIGAYDPWIRNHATPEQSLEMANHMGAVRMMPIHWSTFIQSEEPTLEPMERLKAATAHDPSRVALDTIGQTWRMDPET